MKATPLIGRRIVRVYQNRYHDRTVEGEIVSLEGIELDDGTFLQFAAGETDGDIYIVGVHPANTPRANIITPGKAKQLPRDKKLSDLITASRRMEEFLQEMIALDGEDTELFYRKELKMLRRAIAKASK